MRVENPQTHPVSVEVKWANKWTLRELLDGLEVQLVGQYLRAHDSRFGVYFVGTTGPKRRWEDSDGGARLSFGQVIAKLEARAKEITARDDVRHVSVVGVDFGAHQEIDARPKYLLGRKLGRTVKQAMRPAVPATTSGWRPLGSAKASF